MCLKHWWKSCIVLSGSSFEALTNACSICAGFRPAFGKSFKRSIKTCCSSMVQISNGAGTSIHEDEDVESHDPDPRNDQTVVQIGRRGVLLLLFERDDSAEIESCSVLICFFFFLLNRRCRSCCRSSQTSNDWSVVELRAGCCSE